MLETWTFGFRSLVMIFVAHLKSLMIYLHNPGVHLFKGDCCRFLARKNVITLPVYEIDRCIFTSVYFLMNVTFNCLYSGDRTSCNRLVLLCNLGWRICAKYFKLLNLYICRSTYNTLQLSVSLSLTRMLEHTPNPTPVCCRQAKSLLV